MCASFSDTSHDIQVKEQWNHKYCPLTRYYTPGQKFIELFFNELSHQINGENQQFVNSGMETYHFSKKLWNIVCVGALVTAQCP